MAEPQGAVIFLGGTKDRHRRRRARKGPTPEEAVFSVS